MKKQLKKILFLCCCLLGAFTLTVSAQAAGIKGDINNDGKISLTDARTALKFASSVKTPTGAQLVSGDMDSDGAITLDDVRAILKKSVDIDSVRVLSPVEQITPTKNQGSDTRVKFCKVTELCAETFPATVLNDKSSPLFTTLPKGTFDMLDSELLTDSGSGKQFYNLKSGRRVYANEVKTFTGYKMPYNKIEAMTLVKTKGGSTKMFLALDWRVPFNAVLKPQSYEKGYDGREFNISGGFTPKYIDFTFYYTKAASGVPTFPDSDVVKSCKWIINDDKTATLRVYLREQGDFYGYTTYYDKDNYLVISFKEPADSLKGMVIELDPGHGGSQPGAGSGTGIFEKDITYKIANQLKNYLEDAGATVTFSRDNGSTVPEIEERRLSTIKNDPDMLISIHLDSLSDRSANGSSVYYYTSYSGELAESISQSLPKALKDNLGYNMKNKGSHFYPFRVTRVENCPSVLVECGFISNSSDFKIQNSARGQKYIAKGIFDGIVSYVNEQ